MSTRAKGLLADRYELVRTIGSGGMGSVWEARDRLLDRRVAVKMPARRLASEPSFVERFWREARAAARLSHPNVAQVFDYGVDQGQPYLVMEYVPGETLAARLAREGRLSSAEAGRIAADVADALEAAHESGVVHRDVKPGNVMLVPGGGVKVLDFGVAAAASDAPMTGTGQVLGTPTYMAPEQASGKGATPASDVYALGVILYEMLAGRPPFSGESPLAVASAHVHRDAEPLEDLAPGADLPLVRAARAAMTKDPAQRPASAAAFAAMLRAGSAPGDAPTEVIEPAVPAAGMTSATEVLDPADTAVLPAEPTETAARPIEPSRRRAGVAGWVVAVAALLVVGVVLIVLAATIGPRGTSPGGPPTPAPTVPASKAPVVPSASAPTTTPPASAPTTTPPASPSPSPPSPPSSASTPSSSLSLSGLPTPTISIGG